MVFRGDNAKVPVSFFRLILSELTTDICSQRQKK